MRTSLGSRVSMTLFRALVAACSSCFRNALFARFFRMLMALAGFRMATITRVVALPSEKSWKIKSAASSFVLFRRMSGLSPVASCEGEMEGKKHEKGDN